LAAPVAEQPGEAGLSIPRAKRLQEEAR